jgi:hypothetical protein
MTARTFQGKMYIAPEYASGVKGFTNATAYANSKWNITGADNFVAVISTSGKTVPMSSSLTISEKGTTNFVDGLTNKRNALNEVTIKFNVEAEIGVYDLIKKLFNGVKSEIRVCDDDNMQGFQLMNVVPHFVETTKCGEIQMAEVTCTFKQGATVSNTLRRWRFVDILTA